MFLIFIILYYIILNYRIPSVISLGQIRSVNVLSESEKPFPGYEFFTIGTAARVYYFCVKVLILFIKYYIILLFFSILFLP